MRERGFLLAGPALYAAIGAGVLIVGLSVALKLQTMRLQSCEEKFSVFRLETKLLAEAQDEKNRAREVSDLKLKEKTDADHKAAVARLNRDIKRMRDVHARSSLTPEAPATSRRPEFACFDRTLFAGAIREFEREVEEIVGSGAEATLNLDAAKAWAQALPR